MSKLLFDSFEVKGYRCFEHIKIEKLGRVNLIVGKNNVGKTALLEALWIYTQGSSWNKVLAAMASVLERRSERLVDTIGPSWAKIPRQSEVKIRGEEFRHLFFDRPNFGVANLLIDAKRPDIYGLFEDDDNSIHVAFNSDVAEVFSDSYRGQNFHRNINTLFINSNGLDTEFLTQIWDETILINNEDSVVNSLKIISPQLIDVNFIGYPKGAESRVPVVRINGIDERIPLKSLGEGMSRLLGIALSLVNSKNGILIIDEIESGLHYSVLPDVWKLIFKTAKDLNVQVFATTHSFDCIEAFAQAAIEDKESKGNLIRLENKNGVIKAVTFSENELETVTRRNIEVR